MLHDRAQRVRLKFARAAVYWMPRADSLPNRMVGERAEAV